MPARHRALEFRAPGSHHSAGRDRQRGGRRQDTGAQAQGNGQRHLARHHSQLGTKRADAFLAKAWKLEELAAIGELLGLIEIRRWGAG
jgi:hypothetical protein